MSDMVYLSMEALSGKAALLKISGAACIIPFVFSLEKASRLCGGLQKPPVRSVSSPGHAQVLPAHVAVGRQLAVDGLAQDPGPG